MHKKMQFSITDFFSICDQTADLDIFNKMLSSAWSERFAIVDD